MPIADAPPTIVVTATALPAPAAERLLGVERIGTDKLERAGVGSLDRVLQQAAGVQLFRRSDARSGHPTSQGVTLRALGGNAASRALLILDGVPQSDPFGGWVNWPAYDPSNLEEVLVVRGGGSVADGPGALAGSIRMRSRTDAGVRASAEVGSRGSVAADLNVGAALGNGFVSLSAFGGRGDGFVPIVSEARGPADRPAPYAFGGGRFRYAVPVAASVRLEAMIAGFNDRRERGLAFTANRSRGTDVSVRLLGDGRWNWSALAYAQRREFESSFASANDARTAASRAALQFHVPGRAAGWSLETRPPVPTGWQVRLGTDGRAMKGRSEELGSFSAGVATRDRRSGGKSATQGAFVEVTRTNSPWEMSGTARLDHWQISDGQYRERLLTTGRVTADEQFDDRSGWLPTARLAVGRAVAPGLRLRSAAYLGWRLPTLNELFRPFRAGPDATAANALLKPERLAGVEGGATYDDEQLHLSLTAFVNRLRDPIGNRTLGSGPGLFPQVGFVGAGGSYRQRQNGSPLLVHGLEANGGWHSGPWSIDGSLSLTRARQQSPEGATRRPAQTPALLASASARWEQQGKSLSLQLWHSGAQFEDDENRIRLRPATTVSAYGSLPISSAISLIARAENLANSTVVAGRTSDGVAERATPRTFWLGVRIGRQSR